MRKIPATAEGYRQLAIQMARLARNRTPVFDLDIHSSINLCKESNCPYLQTEILQKRKFTQRRCFCELSGKSVRAIVGCPLKEEKHAAVATAEAERPSTDIEIC